MMNEVNLERDCTFMDGMSLEEICGAIGTAKAGFDEEVNTVVSGLVRLPEADRAALAGEVLVDMEERLSWARETIGNRG